ncbi:MAG TPA: SGNH/GDSL hydrolase family protein, partial [Mucilaginibacter sp.]|nr:SGNH/GDSL hydrolase family protein [Mucilaginibacter sp.]
MKPIIAALGLCLCIAFSANAQTVQPFKQGDRVVFVGNSITDGGRYHAYIWLYYMTHYPTRRITCFNAGIGGDVIGQIADRFDDDVLSKKPTVLTLTWGMNDSGYFEWYRKDAQGFMDKRLAETYTTYAKLENRLKGMPKIKTILIGGSPYDETTKFSPKNHYPGKSAQLARIVEHQEESAKNNHWGFVDFYHPMNAINKREQARDTAFSLTPGDRIHPDNNGHLVMAYLFLKAQGLANNVVADVAVNAADRKVEKAVNS